MTTATHIRPNRTKPEVRPGGAHPHLESHRPLTILFSLKHAGYLRHYGDPVRLLAQRGHRVHLIFSRSEREPGDQRLIDGLVSAYPNVTWELAPSRRSVDGWERIAWLVRAFTDLSRYANPRYADAVALRRRVATKIESHVRDQRGVRWVAMRLLAHLSTLADESQSLRWGRFFERLEAAVPTSRRITRYVAQQCPDAVLVTPLVEVASPQLEYLKSAQKLGVRTGVCIASWDNLTNKGLIRTIPDRVIVWNEIQRREASELHGIPAARVITTGAQKFDAYFDRSPSTGREEFALKVGLDPKRPYLLYLCSSNFVARNETGFVQQWVNAVRAARDPRLRRIGILVRPHPQNAGQWRNVDLSEFRNVVVWPAAGAQPDDAEGRDAFYDSLAHSSSVVGINTTAMIEAGILGKSVYTLLSPEFAETQEGTLHFHYMLQANGGFVRVATGLDEHVSQLVSGLDSAHEDAEQTRRFVESFCRPYGRDQPATPRVAAAIEELAASGTVDPTHISAATLLVRAALWPASLALTVGASLAWFGHQLRATPGARLRGTRVGGERFERAAEGRPSPQLERKYRWR
jgi:hypothetical protein